MPASRPTVAAIDLDALAYNHRSLREFLGENVQIMAIVKANAYGHGAVECSRWLSIQGVEWLGVALVEEAVELRNAQIRLPILCLGGFWPDQVNEILGLDITPAIFDLDQAESLSCAAKAVDKVVDVHIKIDTGMGRIGVPYRQLPEWVQNLRRFENINVTGVMTHFATADDLNDELTNLQMRRFAEAVKIFHENGFRPTVLDIANSPGAIAFRDSRSSMVRIGGLLYGLGDDVLPPGIERPDLKPVMSVASRVAYIKKIEKGDTVGYGKTFSAARPSVIATVPIGYHDGFRRILSNRGHVIVGGQLAPIVGRISMDWTTIDVTDITGVKIGDRVTIIGCDGSSRISAESLARLCDTISYEITCGIGSRVPRVFNGQTSS